jgi:hypothetical protein
LQYGTVEMATYAESVVGLACGVVAAVSVVFFDLDPGPPLGRFGLDCCAGSEASRLLLEDILDAAGEGLTSGVEMFGDAESAGGLIAGPFRRSLIFKDGVPGILNVLNDVCDPGWKC